MNKYSINVVWSDEDDCFVGTVPEFPGLSAFGDTKLEAMEEAEVALRGFLKVYEEDGCPLPEPEKQKKHSGKLRLRLPRGLHETLARSARKEGVSLNQYIVYLLSERNVYRMVHSRLDELEIYAISSIQPMGLKWDQFQTNVSSSGTYNLLSPESVFEMGTFHNFCIVETDEIR